MKKFVRILLAFGLGIIFVFALAEIGIRIWGNLAFQRMTSQKTGNVKFRILCMGNSHTFGSGVPQGKAYSYVLENFFAEERPGFNVSVANAGIGNANTSILIERFPTFVKEGKPDLVLTMAGEPNIWNKYGYAHFEKKITGKNRFDWKIFFGHSRFIRWLLYLPYLNQEKKERSFDLDREAFRILARQEEGHLKLHLDPNEAKRIHHVVKAFLKKNEGKPLRSRFIFYYILASLNVEPGNNLHYLEECVRYGNGNNYLAVTMIDSWIKLEKQKDILKKLKELRKQALAEYEGETNLQHELDAALLSIYPRTYKPQDIRFLEKVSRNFLYGAMITNTLARYYMSIENNVKALQLLEEMLKNNPFTYTDRGSFLMISYLADQPHIKQPVRDAAAKVRREYSLKYPDEAHRFTELNANLLSEWIVYDLGRLNREITSSGALSVFQTYHWIRNMEEGENVNRAIRKFSKKEKVALLDTNQVFRKELAQSGDVESFFTQQFGPNDSHPSEKGHRLIARIIYDYLNDNALIPHELRNLPAKKIYTFSWE